jgi:hypothetical protein
MEREDDEGGKGEDRLEYGPIYTASMTRRVDREKSILGTELEEPRFEEGGGKWEGVRMNVENVSNSSEAEAQSLAQEA